MLTGQAQKEFFVNQSLSMIDALIRGQILASQVNPPNDPVDGALYRVSAPATGDWVGQEGHLAIRVAESWQFVPPYEGQTLFDLNEGNFLIYRSGWLDLDAPPSPQGGSVIDAEARATIDALIATLTNVGILK